jgi:hypothetical protein
VELGETDAESDHLLIPAPDHSVWIVICLGLARSAFGSRSRSTPFFTVAWIRPWSTYNPSFGRPPADPTSAFVPVLVPQLGPVLCHEEGRRVGRDNTVTLDRLVLQISKTARPPDVRRAAGSGAPPPRRPAFDLVGPALPRPLRRGRPAADPLPPGSLVKTGRVMSLVNNRAGWREISESPRRE